MVADTQSEFEVNHAISYAHYVTSLPLPSPYLGVALPRLRALLSGLVAQGSRRSDPSPSTGEVATTMQHALLLQALLKAVLWVGWAVPNLRGEAGTVIAELLEQAETLISGALTFAGVILTAVHSVLSNAPIPSLPPSVATRVLAAAISLGSPANLVKAVREASGTRSPGFRAPE